MSGPAVDGVRVVMGRPRAGHARPLQGGNFCSGRRPQRPAEGSRPLPTVLVEKQVPFGLLGGRGRACPARLWMVYGWLWEGRGPGMPGPLQGGNFCSGRRPQRPAEGSRPLPTVLLWEKQVPFGLLLGGRGRACPARLWMVYGRLWEGRGPGMPGPYRAAIFAAGRPRGMRTAMGRPEGFWPFAAAAHLHHSAGASVASGTGVSSGCGAFASRYA